jgi:glyoxylase-like metal-dependent hydrolase (beta-lactamase superfamily II)
VSGAADLRYDVHVSGMAPTAGRPLPDGYRPQWSPLAHTLVYGPTEALLTDPPITRPQADVLIEWVKGHPVSLRYIYLTHAHADHWLTTIWLDGHELFAHQVGHSDTDDTTILQVPSLSTPPVKPSPPRPTGPGSTRT